VLTGDDDSAVRVSYADLVGHYREIVALTTAGVALAWDLRGIL